MVTSPFEQELQRRLLLMNAVHARYVETNHLTAADLASFEFEGVPTRLINPTRGIWNPRDSVATLSVVSATDGPYPDHLVDLGARRGLFRYSYERGDGKGSNTKLRAAMQQGLPIILFLRPRGNDYVPIAPVYVVEDDPREQCFYLDVSGTADAQALLRDEGTAEATKRYVERMVRTRVHQPLFRHIVLTAYATRCAICELKHGKLLDAAHIVEDHLDRGTASVPNGLALCKIHHAAFDGDLLGISPDYRVQINDELLHEVDGPMLLHGLQEMHGRELILPARRADRPDRDRLAERFARFQSAS